MKVLGLCGWSGCGKTTLLVQVLPLLAAEGLRISTVKHAHHALDLDQPGKDSWRHREAGAQEVLVASGLRWALLHELRGPEPTLDALLARLLPADLVLVEGYKAHAHPKLEVHRPAVGKPPLWPSVPGVRAVVTDVPELPGCPHPLLPLNDPSAVAAWVGSFIASGSSKSGESSESVASASAAGLPAPA